MKKKPLNFDYVDWQFGEEVFIVMAHTFTAGLHGSYGRFLEAPYRYFHPHASNFTHAGMLNDECVETFTNNFPFLYFSYN